MRSPLNGSHFADWLRTKSFSEPVVISFGIWDAEAMLGVSEAVVTLKVPGDEGERLWALLCTA